jgi:hypothetical protein
MTAASGRQAMADDRRLASGGAPNRPRATGRRRTGGIEPALQRRVIRRSTSSTTRHADGSARRPRRRRACSPAPRMTSGRPSRGADRGLRGARAVAMRR